MKRVGQGLVELIYPARCAGCGRRGGWVCTECDGRVVRFAPPWCAGCGVPAGLECRCADLPADLAYLRSAVPFDAWVRRAIIDFKYHDERARADHLADVLRGAFAAGETEGIDALVPVPLHSTRLRARGYNQAALLAERVGQALNIPVIDGLTRVRATVPQVGQHAAERRGNVADAFAARPEVDLRATQLVLIDDVCTTGSTLGACAAALRGAGAVRVGAATVARELA